MSKWRAIHPAIKVNGMDGFRMLRFNMPSYSQMNAIASKLTEGKNDPHEDFMRRLIPEGPLPRNPKDALKIYFTAEASYSFCVGNANMFDGDKNTSSFLVGFRSDKDMFKFLLTWPDAQQITTWQTNIQFFVRIAVDDEEKLKHETV